jgi:ADP-heptose:LPS heptosyltransferase
MSAAVLCHSEHPVAFFANGIGDTFLTLPALRALAKIFEDRLTLICDPRMKEALQENLTLRDIIGIPDLHTDPAIPGRLFDPVKLRSMFSEADFFISLVPWRSASLARLVDLLNSTPSIGLGNGYDIEIPVTSHIHSADLAFRVPSAIDAGSRLEDFSGPPLLPASVIARARQFRKLVPDNASVLVVHPDTTQAKCWDPRKLTRLLDLFLSRYPNFMVWIVGLTHLGHQIERRFGRAVSFLGSSLNQHLALAGEADLFLGVDSCVLHAADLFRVPGVGVFGPTDCHEWGFRFGPHRHVQGAGSMDLVTVDAVLEAMTQLVREHLTYG